MGQLPTEDECYAFARHLAHEIDTEVEDKDCGILPEEWYIYPENIKKLITYCQTPKP
jgi:hypothetical protein